MSTSINQAIEAMRLLHSTTQQMCEILEVDNPKNGLRKIIALREELERTKQQRDAIVEALEVDNWKNAVNRSRALLGKFANDDE